ncbi:hypothetical protein [Synechococcus sp. PCC 6312]|uniref:hypothetical protein n=1 Tax=Synechococcus sp. (strain ATCC 27167 / PCC 6312) TaxID=195253 RepID=UPI00029F3CA4|nr:hypothetical protein [Synechococcus sp. PCC 6312]AFY59637.1 hypothetical protein Syn6312_0407 [Synechococcus sp. PCC 6312]
MNEEIFEACVQYNDLVGSVSADNSDQSSIYKWLDDRKLRNSNELVYGIELSIRENDGEELVNPVPVVLLLVADETQKTLSKKIADGQVPINVRRIETLMTLPEFLSLFKRFNLTLSPNQNWQSLRGSEFKGILEGVRYQYQDSQDF